MFYLKLFKTAPLQNINKGDKYHHHHEKGAVSCACISQQFDFCPLWLNNANAQE